MLSETQPPIGSGIGQAGSIICYPFSANGPLGGNNDRPKDDLHMLEAAVAKSLVEDTARRFAG